LLHQFAQPASMSPGQFGATLMDQTIRTDHGRRAATKGAHVARVALEQGIFDDAEEQ
jgi:hypothetical protein